MDWRPALLIYYSSLEEEEWDFSQGSPGSVDDEAVALAPPEGSEEWRGLTGAMVEVMIIPADQNPDQSVPPNPFEHGAEQSTHQPRL